MPRKKKVPLPPQPPKAILNEGDVVRLVLDYHMATHTNNEHLSSWWKSINGKIGVVTDIVSDDEVWVQGRETQEDRRFNAYTLEKLTIEC